MMSQFLQYGTETRSTFGGFPLLAFLLVYLWARPVFKFIADPENDELREVTRHKVENISQSVFHLYVILFIVTIGREYYRFSEVLIPGRFWYCILPAVFLSYLTQVVFMTIYVNTNLFSRDSLFVSLYSKEELYQKQGGRTFTLWTKVLLLTVFNNLLPIGTIVYLFYGRYAFALNRPVLQTVTFSLYYSLIITIVGLGFLSKGFSRPVTELNKKMDLLAAGDFNVKSRIYSNDEIGALKLHFNEMVDKLRDREKMNEMFGRYLSVEIAKKLFEGDVNLGGEEVSAAILFSDIRNFTSMSEKMSPSEVIQFLNRYFSFITEPILKRQGVINKFIGDAVMVIFSPVFGNEHYCEQALLTAVEMKAHLVEFNVRFPEYNGVEFGIGIHAGVLIAGNVGVKERLEYTVIGDTVNLASRLEGKTKELKKDIIISEAVLKGLTEDLPEQITVENVDIIQVKGKEEKIKVFTVS
jgi:adenylate cyclase